jgi:rifampicin phosphotransferase
VNPDHFVVNTATGEIVERRLGDKRFVIKSTAGGGTTHVTRDTADSNYCISDDQVRALVKLGARVAAHYGSPQDTEWAIDHDGVVWLTQARPVTTLFPLPAARSTEDLRVYFCFSLAQGLHRPLTPMGLSLMPVIGTSVARTYGLPVADPLVGPSGVTQAAGRLFFDITTLMQHRLGREVFPKVLDVMEARSAVVLRNLRNDPRLPPSRSPWPFLRRVARIAMRFKIPFVVARAVLRPAATRRRLAAMERDLVRRATPPDNLTPAERLEFIIKTPGETVVSMMTRVLPAAAAGFAMLGLAGKLLGDDAQSDDLQGVLRALPHNVTTEMDLALWDVATVIRRNGAEADLVRTTPAQELAAMYNAGTLPPRVQRELSAFLDKYGHRAVAEIDVGVPRWSDDPAHILGVLANYLRLDDPKRAPDAMFTTGAAEADALVATLTARARQRGPLRGLIVGFALDRARQLAGLRELPKYYLIVVLASLRRQLRLVGAELAARGVIAAPDDVFFLTLREAQIAVGGDDMRDIVRQRREEYAHEMRRRHVPRVLLSDGTEPEAQLMTARKVDGALTGTPASAGSVTGQARVIMDPVGAHLEPGEILIAPSTDPGWTPLFLTAGGLVMEMGGANSHGAVVAREYGIPAVVGVDGATSQLSTGQTITVDGTNGVITTAVAPAATVSHHAEIPTTP